MMQANLEKAAGTDGRSRWIEKIPCVDLYAFLVWYVFWGSSYRLKSFEANRSAQKARRRRKQRQICRSLHPHTLAHFTLHPSPFTLHRSLRYSL